VWVLESALGVELVDQVVEQRVQSGVGDDDDLVGAIVPEIVVRQFIQPSRHCCALIGSILGARCAYGFAALAIFSCGSYFEAASGEQPCWGDRPCFSKARAGDLLWYRWMNNALARRTPAPSPRRTVRIAAQCMNSDAVEKLERLELDPPCSWRWREAPAWTRGNQGGRFRFYLGAELRLQNPGAERNHPDLVMESTVSTQNRIAIRRGTGLSTGRL